MNTRVPDEVVLAMHAEVRAGASLSSVARKHGRNPATLYSLFEVRGLPFKLDAEQRRAARAQDGLRRRAKLDAEIAAMHADYVAGLSLAAVGRKYRRERSSVRELFSKRGLAMRPSPCGEPVRLENGRIAAAPKLTEAEIHALIEGATKLAVPRELKREWRVWPLHRRALFILRLRLKLMLPEERPDLPFSDNVTPFEYGTPEAWEIVRRMNAGLPSREWKAHLKIHSQGVIWRGRLAYWSHEGKDPGVGAYYIGPWTEEGGRPAVHRLIWEDHHGRKVPDRLVVFHLDGNRNNLAPDNLELASKNDVCRRNQAAALSRKSRELTSILLQRQTGQPNAVSNDHDHADTLSTLSRSHR